MRIVCDSDYLKLPIGINVVSTTKTFESKTYGYDTENMKPFEHKMPEWSEEEISHLNSAIPADCGGNLKVEELEDRIEHAECYLTGSS